MFASKVRISLQLAIGLGLLMMYGSAYGQTQNPQNPKPPEPDDVVRVYSDLVQTDVMVFDKDGKFVNGLKREDFELRVDGKPRPVEFFERITAGTGNEEAQLAAARGIASGNKTGAVPLDRGRTVFFFVDDFHLAPGSMVATRKLLQHYIEHDMGQNDEAAITSASGQIGFLQQLTDNQSVLRGAIARLNSRGYTVRDMDHPPMSEYQALAIEHYDRDLLQYFIDYLVREGVPPQTAAGMVTSRASNLLQQAARITTNTLDGLEGLVRSTSKLPGRKLLFFISDGFFLDERNSNALERMRRLTSAAARSGVVIYSMDARGLVASLTDASTEQDFDPTGRVARSSAGELLASQDTMNALARDTGGRPIFNTNALEVGMNKALQDTSVYYLLAWRTDHDQQASGKFRRISISLVQHPNLSVRVRPGFFEVEPATNAKAEHIPNKQPSQPATPQSALREAVGGIFPTTDIPVAVNVTFLNTRERGPLITVTMQLNAAALQFSNADAMQKALVDISGALFNDQGKTGGGFSDRLTVTANTVESQQPTRDLVYSYQIYAKPGLYQVRVGARDAGSGKVGTANEWIEIPKLDPQQLALSSLITGERPLEPTTATATDENVIPAASIRIDHRFHRNSFLRFIVYAYNAALSAADGKPDVAVQVQVLRDAQPVITRPSKRLVTDGLQKFDQIPYGADISLEGLASGRYVLQISVVDRIAKSTASQQFRFEVE
jgi:VWFA-related protein